MKPKLDERQMQDAARIAGISFYVMYMVCAVFSIVFTVFFAFAIRRKAGPETEIRTAVLLFFAGITVLCFFTLKLMDFMTERKRRQQEQKYADEE